MNFKTFCLSLKEWQEKPLNDYNNNHFRPCSFFIDNFTNGKKITTFQLENLESCLDYLKEIGVNKKLIKNFPHKNKSTIKGNTEFFFDEATLTAIHNIFRKDFELGRYDIRETPFSLWV